MTDHSPRLFTSDAEIVRIGEGLLARTLPRPDWTHEAHLAATSYLLTRRPEIDLDSELPEIIAMRIERGLPAYLDWVAAETKA